MYKILLFNQSVLSILINAQILIIYLIIVNKYKG